MSMIYLIECRRDYETVYKIGYSKNSPSKRSDGLQTGNDGNLLIINRFCSEHNRQVESALHRIYSHKNINREWFKLDLDDVQNFTKMCEKIENNLNILRDSKI